MSRRGMSLPVPSSMSAPVLLGVAVLAAGGLPSPRTVDVYAPRPSVDSPGWADLRLNTGAEVHAWAAQFGQPAQIKITDEYVRTRVRNVPVAGLDADVSAIDYLDDQADVDARDRAADIGDLAAARLAGAVV
jgi:hypothetical protein